MAYQRKSEGTEPMTLEEMLVSFGVCSNYLQDGFAKIDSEDDYEPLKHFLWVQQRLAEIQHSLSVHMEDMVGRY